MSRSPLLLPCLAALPTLLPTLLHTAPARAARGEPVVAVLVAPAQLALPQLELTADIRLAPDHSVAGIVGFNAEDVIRFHHAGAQYRYTFSGDWSRGTFLGAEVQTGDGSWYHAESRGIEAGAFVGGRYTFSPALTLEGALGGRGWWRNRQLEPGVVVNLGLGWSF